eukprot:11294278-Alexandrium_andersonii.AAC.1
MPPPALRARPWPAAPEAMPGLWLGRWLSIPTAGGCPMGARFPDLRPRGLRRHRSPPGHWLH